MKSLCRLVVLMRRVNEGTSNMLNGRNIVHEHCRRCESLQSATKFIVPSMGLRCWLWGRL